MGRLGRLGRWVWVLPLSVVAAGQTSQPNLWELPEAARAALSQIHDLAFNFDQPGFYEVLAFVKHNPQSPGFQQEPIVVDDWRMLLERPSAFRGRPVTVEGVVGRNSSFKWIGRPEFGDVWKIGIRRDDQPITCTLIFTENANDIPLGATITVTGYFVMMHQYYNPSHRVEQAALLVAPGPTVVSRPAPSSTETGGLDWRWMLAAVVFGLLVTVIVLRQAGRGERHDVRALRASHDSPVNVAEDFESWAIGESGESAESDEFAEDDGDPR